jgi:formylmethanofuran dehydrogenase subunit E
MTFTLCEKKACGKTLDTCLRIIETFHGWKAPGLVLGLWMVDWALELIGDGVEADAIVETRHCLPDAVQLFTPCTAGNGWMKILDWDKFALSLFDRRAKHGYRVWFDLEKAKQFPKLYQWYMRLIPKRELPLDVLLAVILQAGRRVLSSEAIIMLKHHQRVKKTAINVCPLCNEAYAATQGPICLACRGNGYYGRGKAIAIGD